MGLLSIIKKQREKDREIRILTLGLDNSGKTTVVKKILNEDTDKVSPTMGFQINTVIYGDYTLNIWDIGGQTTLRSFWGNYFERTNVVMWVVDCLSQERLRESYKELREKVILQDKLVGIYLAVLVNKIDLINAEKFTVVEEQIRNVLDLNSLPDKNKITVQLVSGKTGEGLPQVLNWITTRVY
ncbi:uncharacterized protein PRCAT00000055001 [Priceomyces carsonii]|uniref:uncharacterized protein n=1 Tax=Priceomyces carsonii TaxID=28549 RepID=UPI002ED8CA8F|nr:unnamed protein product [Priceomyces carsonii]